MLLVKIFVIAANNLLLTKGENAIKVAVVAEKGEPETGVNRPVDVLTEYTEMLEPPVFNTAANRFPDTRGENTTPFGPLPVEKGEPATAVNAPVTVLTENTETELPLVFATATNKLPLINGENAAYPFGEEPVAKGEPEACVKVPKSGST